MLSCNSKHASSCMLFICFIKSLVTKEAEVISEFATVTLYNSILSLFFDDVVIFHKLLDKLTCCAII